NGPLPRESEPLGRSFQPCPTPGRESAGLAIAQLADGCQLGGQHGQLGFHHGNFGLVLGLTQGFFSLLACGFGLGFVQVLATDGRISQHSNGTRLDLQQATGHENEFFLAVFALDLDRTGADARDQRSMARQDTQLARFTRQRYELCFTSKDRRFSAYDIYVNGCHGASLRGLPRQLPRRTMHSRLTQADSGGAFACGFPYFSVLAFSKASSMLPTM